LALQGTHVRVASRRLDRAQAVCQQIQAKLAQAHLEPIAIASDHDLQAALSGEQLVVAAGAAAIQLLPAKARHACPTLKVAIDLNAVPPLGIEGVEVTDKGATRDGVIVYGAIGVGDTKMKTHKLAIARLFERNDQILDAEEVY